MTGPLVALTGATGFLGRHLLAGLPRSGIRVRALLRRPAELPPETTGAVVGDLTRPRDMAAALRGVDAVVHSAGLAHTMSGRPEDDYRALNTEATLALARAAERAGVRRFVFLSSVRAMTGPSAARPLTEADPPAPTDAYGRSKLAAEEALADLAIDWVALRPVLVYGAGAKGNLAALLAAARSPWPLPLAGLRGRRSLVGAASLVAAVETVLRADGPLRRPLLVTEDHPLTVAGMVTALRAGLGRSPGLLPCPPALIGIAARVLGREEAFARLSGSLVARNDALAALGWRPAAATSEGLADYARRSAESASPAQ